MSYRSVNVLTIDNSTTFYYDIFHPISLDFFRQLQGIRCWTGIEWLMTWQSASDVIRWLVPSVRKLKSEPPSFVEGRFFYPLPNCLPYSHVQTTSLHRQGLFLPQHQPINTNSTSNSLQLPEDVQWDWTKICHSKRSVQYLIYNSILYSPTGWIITYINITFRPDRVFTSHLKFLSINCTCPFCVK